MIATLALLLVMVVLPGPDGSYKSSALDLEERVAPPDWPYTRYLSLYAVPEERRPDLIAACTYWINALSSRRALYRPPLVADGTLLRIDLRRLGWDREARRETIALAARLGVVLRAEEDVWEQLARRDPYYKVTTKVLRYVGGYAREVIVRGWLDPKIEAVTRTRTRSRTPVVRADWFLFQAGYDRTDVPNKVDGLYSDFMLLPSNAKDLQKLLGVDEKLIGGRAMAFGGAVVRSGVALHNRSLEVLPTQYGGTQRYLWRTYDVRNNIKERSVKENLVGADGFSTVRADGGELIWELPNGLQGYYVIDGQGRQIAEVPQDVAFRKGHPLDATVYNAWTCTACHDRGMIDFADVIRPLAVNDQPVGIAALDGEKRTINRLTRIAEEYHLSDRLPAVIEANRRAYSEAVRKCTGVEPEANARGFIAAIETYQYGLLDLAAASREMGVTEDEFRGMARRSASAELLGLLAGVPASRDAFEASFEAGMTAKSWPWEQHR